MQQVVRCTKARDRRREALEEANRELARAIRAALAAGESAADIAFVADISRARVYQIRDGRR